MITQDGIKVAVGQTWMALPSNAYPKPNDGELYTVTRIAANGDVYATDPNGREWGTTIGSNAPSERIWHLFVQAHHCLRLPPNEFRSLRWCIVHSTETSPGSAVSIARQWALPSYPRKVSAHYIVEPQHVVQCVREHDVAYAAGAANRWGIHIEHVGRAIDFKPTPAQQRLGLRFEPRTKWASDEEPWCATTMLTRSARLAADIAYRNGIQVRRLTPEDLLEENGPQSGFASHGDVTRAVLLAKKRNLRRAPWFRPERPPEEQWVKSDHLDPDGKFHDWPWSWWLDTIARELAELTYKEKPT